jgi:hypothetical protein
MKCIIMNLSLQGHKRWWLEIKVQAWFLSLFSSNKCLSDFIFVSGPFKINDLGYDVQRSTMVKKVKDNIIAANITFIRFSIIFSSFHSQSMINWFHFGEMHVVGFDFQYHQWSKVIIRAETPYLLVTTWFSCTPLELKTYKYLNDQRPMWTFCALTNDL